jgi:hypothetical protein
VLNGTRDFTNQKERREFNGDSNTIPAALLFTAAMLCFFLGPLWFLREIYLATMNLRIGPR